jgi:pSer/pThr/pTyr-binding forkhead associated (FHA) protein
MSGSSLKVKLFDPSGTQVIPVAKSNLTIGSAKHCDVVLQNASVHGEHLRAWFDGGRVWIQDMGSTNGTFLNGIRLPSLKPMLVRELDVLKLGENPVTLGLEANMVRAPVVRATSNDDTPIPVQNKAAALKDAELEKKREDLARMRRELAELKLQLQMGRLDKDAEDEAHRQLSLMRAEINNLTEQKTRLERSMQKMDQLRQSQLSAVDNEINERKTSAMNQLKNLMDHEMSKLAEWKMQVMTELRRDIHVLSQTKAKAWVTRPLSTDMILEWEADLQALLRRLILGEKEELPMAAVANSDVPPPQSSVTLPNRRTKERRATERRTGGEGTLVAVSSSGGVTYSDGVRSSFTPPPRNKKRAFNRDRIKVALMSVFVGSLVMAAVLFKQGVIPIGDRDLASSAEMAGTRGRKRFEPAQSKLYKKSYTDNALYTENFIDMELSPGYRTQWLVDFNKTATSEWKIDMATARVIADKELMLLQDLKRLREAVDAQNETPGIQAMRDRESMFQKELDTLLKGKALSEKYSRLKKTVFARLQTKKP